MHIPDNSYFNFDRKYLTSLQLPDVDTAVKAAKEHLSLLSDKKIWSKGKTYNLEGQTIETATARREQDFWMVRESKHKDVPFEKFKQYILEDHTKYEVEYIELLQSFEQIDEAGDWKGEYCKVQ